ncbi:unnamed protein product [Parnassius apollo]|uniref:(apollo) hypothetical protein n=1 Tax=Parnassius apollo TaxID=110799 RepID=A0A8S3W4Q1_PARAO|nr:unnamed protein product [Parnassius apollo]
MSTEEKTNACKEVQKRWLNLRNCFSRELRLQRETKSGQSAKKRCTYLYFERLMFLLPTIDPRETASNISTESDDGDGTESLNTERMRPPRPLLNNNKAFEQSLLNMLERNFNVQQNETTLNDEDRNFALSLVSMLQRFSIYDKIDVKVQILNIFKEKCAPQHDLRKIRIINQQIIPPKPMTNPGRGPPPAISPGPSQTQNALPEDRMQPTPSPSTYDTNESVQSYYSNCFVDDYE